MEGWPIMDVQAVDLKGLAFVISGTVLAMLARSGPADCREVVHHIRAMIRPGFDLAKQRAALAGPVRRAKRDGVIRAEPAVLDDPEIDAAYAAMCSLRSTDALLHEHEAHQVQRSASRERAQTALEQGGELAPVVGLAGTLLALSQMPSAGHDEVSGMMSAVSMAVVSTLSGLLLAHLVLLPLAAAIRRRGEQEEALRDELFAWLVLQLAPACPQSKITSDQD